MLPHDSLLSRLRSTPAYLADETGHALCSAPPPFGLRARTDQIVALLSSKAIISNHTVNESAPCLQLAAVAAWRTVGGQTLSSDSYQQPLHRSCAVVGSGGGLRGSGLGESISRHEAIFRFNLAPTRGFEADVGNRTTYIVGSHHPWRTAVRTPSRAGPSSSLAPASSPPPRVALYCFNAWLGSCWFDALERRRTPAGATLINPVLARRLQAAQKRNAPLRFCDAAPRGAAVRPSTGLVGVALALSLCAPGRVRLYGFGNDTDTTQAAL